MFTCRDILAQASEQNIGCKWPSKFLNLHLCFCLTVQSPAELASDKIAILAPMMALWKRLETTPNYDGLADDQKNARIAMRAKASQEVLALMSLVGPARACV